MHLEKHIMFEKALVALDLSPAEQPILDCLLALRNWGMRQVVLTVSVVLLATVAASYWFFFRWSTYELSWDPPPHVSADGRTIRLSYMGGSPTGDCRTEGRISVHEGQDRVVLTVTVAELRFTGGCNGAGYRRIAVAHLDQALGQRKLVDGHKF